MEPENRLFTRSRCGKNISRYVALSLTAFILILGAFFGLLAEDYGTTLRFIRSPNEPVQVIGVRSIKSGQSNSRDLLIEIENLSTKSIRFVGYTVAPADCPRSDHPAAYNIGYGDWAAVSVTEKHVDAAIPAHARKEVLLPASVYSGYLSYQKSHGCSSDQRSEVWLKNVAFCDGTGWEGFADGPAHSEWNGRDWKPSGLSNCDHNAH
jgi:hypothetical protein